MGQITVGTRYPEETVEKIDRAAAALKIDRSAYMRMVIDDALGRKWSQDLADAYREAPRQKRADAGASRTATPALDTRPLARQTVEPRPKAGNGKRARG